MMSTPPNPDQPVPPPAAPHQYLKYIGQAPDKAIVRELAVQLANHFFRHEQLSLSRNQWSKEPKRVCDWELLVRNEDESVTPSPRKSTPLQLSDIERHLSTNGTLRFADLGLPDPMCRWLDASMKISPGFHALPAKGSHSKAAQALTFYAKSNLGPRFPLVPTLDREGTAYTSFQSSLLTRLGTLRAKLVATSDVPHEDTWFEDFRALVGECVALIENTLHQAYFKAQYDPLPGWTFDPAALGERHGRRILDKIKWIYQITGHEFHADSEIKAFVVIKGLRNHLQHFDPPSFACTWEEMADWLNAALGVAQLAWRMRTALGATPSVPLIALLLQRRVTFSPKDPTRPRFKQPAYVGYASTSEQTLAKGAKPSLLPGHILMHGSYETRILRSETS
ncbi:hypothetical protein WME98_24700 [Sorangium sp. So ce296]|uniref:hypothetical protein n=1 Tax=Sorangium sp. So ce296 TaxID=3133296 RepID=UPI003F5F6745